MEIRQETTRHDSAARRKTQRRGRETGCRIYVSASELRAAGIDPHGPPPEYRIWPDTTKKGGFRMRLYT